MIDLPPKKPTLPKVCKSCNVSLNKDNGIVRQGYMIRQCKSCNKKRHREYNKKIQAAKKQFRDWYG